MTEKSKTRSSAFPVVLEENEGYTSPSPVQNTDPGGGVSFVIRVKDGYRPVSVSDGKRVTAVTDENEAEAEEEKLSFTEGTYGSYTVSLQDVAFPTMLTLQMEKSSFTLTYDPGDGEEPLKVPVTDSHERLNTAGADLFSRDGYTLIGWESTEGDVIGCGSRAKLSSGETLKAVWAPWTKEGCFTVRPYADGVEITGCDLEETDNLVIPETIDGKRVRTIGKGAFEKTRCKSLVLPKGLYQVSDGAFRDLSFTDLYLFDDIEEISDRAFSGCDNFQTLHIERVEAPAYAGTYYAAFADKLDRLRSLKDQKKIVLFSGSSTRFGYDSAEIEAAFPSYHVVNMGVFAYTNALPQLSIIRSFLKEGDILIDSPEFDAAKRQFCTTNEMDSAFFCLIEEDYDAMTLLDVRDFSNVLDSFCQYTKDREGMEEKSPALSPADFDEDGNPVQEKSYNEYGDYCLYRANAKSDDPVYGLPVDYTRASYPKDYFIDPYNEVARSFTDLGVSFFFTYSPRNRLAVSDAATKESLEDLDQYFSENLSVPVLGRVEDLLMPGRYFYGTDNHLSTEGVQIRTSYVISCLEEALDEAK